MTLNLSKEDFLAWLNNNVVKYLGDSPLVGRQITNIEVNYSGVALTWEKPKAAEKEGKTDE